MPGPVPLMDRYKHLIRFGGRVAAGVKEAKPPLLNRKSQPLSGLACCVDYIGKTSNFFEDLLKLDRFSKSFEDELNRIVTKEEKSREDL